MSVQSNDPHRSYFIVFYDECEEMLLCKLLGIDLVITVKTVCPIMSNKSVKKKKKCYCCSHCLDYDCRP